MRGVHLFMFLVALPAIAAFAHDIYLFYIEHGMTSITLDINKSIEDKGALSMFAALGFIWTQYHPESYKWIIQNLDQETLNTINTLLMQKAVFLGIAFAGFFYCILFILKIFNIWPFKKDQPASS